MMLARQIVDRAHVMPGVFMSTMNWLTPDGGRRCSASRSAEQDHVVETCAPDVQIFVPLTFVAAFDRRTVRACVRRSGGIRFAHADAEEAFALGDLRQRGFFCSS